MDNTEQIKQLVSYLDIYGETNLYHVLRLFPDLDEGQIRRVAKVLESPIRLGTTRQETTVQSY